MQLQGPGGYRDPQIRNAKALRATHAPCKLRKTLIEKFQDPDTGLRRPEKSLGRRLSIRQNRNKERSRQKRYARDCAEVSGGHLINPPWRSHRRPKARKQ